MRTLNPSLALASLVGFLAAASCTLITDVDRTKIPTDAGAEGGSPGTGGTGGSVETGGSSGTVGEAGQPNAGAGGTSENTGGTSTSGGTGGNTGGSGGTAPPTEVCTHATGSITIKPVTFFSDGDTFTLNDGVDSALVFEFDLDTAQGVASGHQAIAFNGTENQFQAAVLVRDAINKAHHDGSLRIAAETSFPDATDTGAAGGAGTPGNAGGGGAPAAGGASGGGESGVNLDDPANIGLTNDLAGARGNVRIKDTVGNPGFTTSGMSGGKAVVCSSDASCSTDDECGSGTCGDDHVCQ